MKTPSDELFRLIQSLDTQEKVYFKLFAARKTEHNNYVILFDAIDQQEVYDEGALKETLKKEAFVKNLKQAKSYASEAILKSLQEYHSSDSVVALLCNHIMQIEILVKKRLFNPANKLIAKAEKLAKENYKLNYLSIVLWLKREVLVAQGDLQAIDEYQNRYYAEEIECLEQVKNTIEYIRLSMLVIQDTFSHFQVSDKKKEQLRMLLNDPLMMDERKALSFPAKIQFHRNLGNIHALLNEHETSYKHYKEIARLMEENPAFLHSKIESYMMGVNNMIVMLIRKKDTGELSALYYKMKALVNSIPKKLLSNSVFEVFMIINSNYINYLIQYHEIDKGINLSEELIPAMKKHAGKSSFLVFHMNLVLLYFYRGLYRKALHQLNVILNAEDEGIRRDVLNQARLINIFIHYSLENYDLLPGLSRAAERYFKKREILTEGRLTLFHFFNRKNFKTLSKGELQKELIQLKTTLEPIILKEKIFEEFELMAWLESLINERPMLDVLRSNK